MSGSRGITRIQDADDLAAFQDPAAATKGLRSLGTGAAQAAAGNDSRLSDARTPTAHASSHQNGGSDEIATATAAANAIPKAGSGARLARLWLPAGVVADDSIWDAKGDAVLGSGADTAVKVSAPAALTTRRVYTGDGTTGWVDLAHFVARSADSSSLTSSTTLANDSTLLWAVAANETWYFEAKLIFNAANATMDAKVGWSVPTSCTMKWAPSSDHQGTVADFGRWGVTATGVAAPLIESSSQATASFAADFFVGYEGWVFNGANAGNVTLQWAQNTSDAGALKLLKGSLLFLWRIA